MPRPLAFVAMLVSLAAPAMAVAQDVGAPANPPEGFTWLVLSQLNGMRDDPEDPTNGPPVVTEVPEGIIKGIDINHDGDTDWLIEWPESVQFCGTGGCVRSLYVSGANGFSRAFDRQVLEFEIKPGDVTRIEAVVHHGECPTQEAEGDWDCRYAWAWNETARAFIPVATTTGVSLMEGAGGYTVDAPTSDGHEVPLTGLPTEVEALWSDLKVTCPANWTETGYEVSHPVISRLPDVDSDGVPDWSVVQPSACGAGLSSKQTRIWRTGADNTATVIYESAEAARFRTDISSSPAVLSFSPPCDGEGDICRYVPLHWNEVTQTLEE